MWTYTAFSAPFVMIAEMQKQPRGPPTEERIDKMWSVPATDVIQEGNSAAYGNGNESRGQRLRAQISQSHTRYRVIVLNREFRIVRITNRK